MIFILMLIGLLGHVENIDEDNWDVAFTEGLFHLIETREESPKLKEALQGVEFPLMYRPASRIKKRIFTIEPLQCKLCKAGVGVLLKARRMGIHKDSISYVLTKLCHWLKIEDKEVCQGFLNHNMATFVYIVDNRPDLTASKVCATVLQDLQCKDPERRDWSLDIPPYPTYAQNNVSQNPHTGSLKVVQITDLHYDPNYSAGSNANCGLPICCQNGTVPESHSSSAGYWSDHRNCDAPWHAILDLFEHIREQHQTISYVYFTGDIINHKVYDTHQDRNTEDITKIYMELKRSFKEIPVYPILGNHEPHPVNQFSSEDVDPNLDISTQWIFNLTAELWKDWLPKETQATIRRGGYYTALVRSGFRIVVLNSNVCYTYNFWLLYDDYDPFGQLQWLIDTLVNAETHNEKVHILSHVPSGDSTCFRNWGREYNNIVNRFSHVIAAQFNGHTHYDDTVIYYSTLNRSQAINVAFNGGSFTTYSDLNPNYKIYDVDATGMEIINFESWTYNITHANRNFSSRPKWYKLYDFKSAYNVASLHPQELSALVERMTTDRNLTQTYFRYRHRDAEPMADKGCDSECEMENICTMVTSAFGDDYHCKLYTKFYKKNR